MSDELYVSTDIEADGPIPGPHSMLSFASAVFTASGEMLGTFSANLEPLPGAAADRETSAFWSRHRAAYDATRADLRDPAEVMPEYAAWVEALPGRPTFTAYPAAFDFMWVSWYLHRFAGRNPFSHSALDIKTFAMSMLGKAYQDSAKTGWPKRWTSQPRRHTHIALDDAIEQGEQFCAMLRERNGG